ncbi:MAG TPA: hypothetical protein VKQ52_18805 [Puia sp.]|nr:hypothetical protein [Puia sp.]
MPKIFPPAGSKLLRRYPHIWLTRLHVVLPATALLLVLSFFLGRRLPLLTSHTERIWQSLLVLSAPCVFWIRWQYLHYQPYHRARDLYRFFLLNTMAGLLAGALLISTDWVMSRRIMDPHSRTAIYTDFRNLRIFAYYEDSLFAQGTRHPGARDPAGRPPIYQDFTAKALAEDSSLHNHWPSYASVREQALKDTAKYDLPLYRPGRDSTMLRYYLNITLFDRESLVGDIVPILTSYVEPSLLLYISPMFGLLLLHFVAGRSYRAFVSPLIAMWFLILLLLDLGGGPFGEGFTYMKTIDLLLYGLSLAGLFLLANGRRSSPGMRELSIQVFAYGAFLLWNAVPFLLSDMDVKVSAGYVNGWSIAPALFYLSAFWLLFYYIRWYLSFTKRPRRLG